MEDLQELISNGHWTEAIKLFKTINPSGREYGEFLLDIADEDELRDLALLGFYAREYQGNE